jgi:hypothetical protein
MLKDMILPSTADETILSMTDVECRDSLYRSDLKVANVEFWQPKCCCTRQGKQKKGNAKDEIIAEKREEKCSKQHETHLVGVHRERALEKGHFRKDRHRSFRIAVYLTRRRSQTT